MLTGKYIVLFFVILMIIIWPYIRCLFKRLMCIAKIKKVCRNKNYKSYSTHPLWFFGRKHSKKSDLYIETANEVFAIKLFGMPRRRTILIIKENGEYFIRSFVAIVSYGSAMRFPIDSKPRPMPIYNFRYEYRVEWETKTPRRILLVNPVSMEFRYQSNQGSEITLGTGDTVNGMEICSLPYLLGELENAI